MTAIILSSVTERANILIILYQTIKILLAITINKLIKLFKMGQPKDNISAGLDALLGGSKAPEVQLAPEPRRRGFNLGHGGQSAIKDRMATSLVVNRCKYAKIRQIAIDNSLNINEVIDVALDMVIETNEKKYGPISASESRISASDIIRSRKK